MATNDGRWTFERTDTPTIMDGWVVRWRIRSRMYDGEINASRNGISICGRWPIFRDPETIEEIKGLIDRAVKQWAHLKAHSRNDPLPEDGHEL